MDRRHDSLRQALSGIDTRTPAVPKKVADTRRNELLEHEAALKYQRAMARLNDSKASELNLAKR